MNLAVNIVVAALPIVMVLLSKACLVGAFGTLVWFAADAAGKLRLLLVLLAIFAGGVVVLTSFSPVDVIAEAYPKLNAEGLR